jgi:branched-chain amino acid transport system ATP-binding protein
MALLAVDDVGISFGGLRAVDAVSFGVEAREIFAIIGPNGAGKTTLFNLISRIYEPGSGRIVFDEQDITRIAPHAVVKAGIARTFQNIALFKGMTVLDNVMTGRNLKMRASFVEQAIWIGRARREELEHRRAVEEIIDFMEIQHIRKTPVGKLPYGLQKRVELARALAAEPTLLLLDEPAAGMNPEEGQRLVAMIRQICARGITVLLVEHHMRVVMNVCHRVIVIDHGVKIAEGAPAEIARHPEVIRVYFGREAAGA